MRKLFTLLLMTLLPLAASADYIDAEIDGICYYLNTKNKTAMVTSNPPNPDNASISNNYSGVVSIPNIIKYQEEEYTVTSIGVRAFMGCDNLYSVILPQSVTFVNQLGFNSSGLTSIDASSVEKFEISVFAFCSKLEKVVLSDKLEIIPRGLFSGCTSLKSIVIPSGVTYIELSAFRNCDNLTSVFVKSKTPCGIDPNAFPENFEATLYVPVGSKADYAAADVWKNFKNIVELEYMEGDVLTAKTEEGVDMTFKVINGLDKTCQVGEGEYKKAIAENTEGAVTVPDQVNGLHVTSIGAGAFYYCRQMTSISLPESLLTIEGGAFEKCHSLTSIKLPSSLRTIGGGAFYNCLFEEITIPATVTSIQQGAFKLCNRLTSVTVLSPTPLKIDETTFSTRANVTLKVPAGCKAAYEAADYWKEFKEIVENDISDGDWFMGKTAEGLDMNFQVISAKDKTCKVAAKKFDRVFHAIDIKTEGVVTIPAEVNGFKVVAIDDMAFYYCGGVTSFVLPEGLISIGAEAFEKCWAVESFNIPSTVTTIKGGAFYNCLFERITIPKSVTSIGESLFFLCNKLNSVVVEDGNPVYDSRDNCNAIVETATNRLVATCPGTVIPSSVKIIGAGAISGNDVLAASLPEGVEVIEDKAFYRISLGSIILPSTIKSMGTEIFGDQYYACNTLTSVTVKSAEPAKISDKTFDNCPNLTTLNVPAGSKAAYAAAEGWKDFKEIVEAIVEEEIVYSPNQEEKTVSVQASDESQSEVEIQPSVTIEGEKYEVTAIAESAFANNTTIEKVTIPETISEIGENAFAGCRNLKEIRVFAGEPIYLGSSTAAGTRGSGASSVFAEVDMETCVLYVPAGSKEKYEQAEGWSDFKNIVEMGETAAITIGKSGKASYCGDKSLDFGYSDKVKAYIATGFDKDEGTIWLTRVKDVPAGVPVLIKGEANKTYDVPVTDSQNSYYTNMFVGNTSGEKMVIQETDGDLVNYYLSGDGTFKSVNKTANIGTNKCYLQLPGTFEAAVTGAAQTVKIGSIGKASFAAPVDLDFTNVSGLKAFTATGYDKSTKTIWLTRVMKVQKGEGVLLKGDPDNYEIPSAAVQSRYENMFVGNTSGDEIQVLETSEDGSQTNYYLKGDGSFVSVKGYVNIKNNKCYLALPTSMVAVSSTRSAEDSYKFEEPEVIKLPIDFKSIGSEGDGTTGVKEVKSGEVKGDEWYTLQGQRVAKPGKGVYIRNGKKVVIK